MDRKKLRLLIINYEYPPLGGGGGVATKSIAEGIASRGHKVCVLSTKFKGLPRFEEVNGVKIYRVGTFFRKDRASASIASMIFWVIPSFFVGLYVIFRQRINVLNTHFLAPSGPLGMALSFFTFVKNVIYLHGADVYDPSRIEQTPSGTGKLAKLLWLNGKLCLTFADAVVAQSNDTKARTVNLFKIREKDVQVIPLPFMVPNYTPQARQPATQPLKLVSVGRLVKRKQFNVLIKAVSKLNFPFVLNILGDGPELQNLQELVANLALTNNVFFRGYVEEGVKYQYLNMSDLFVLASSHEGMGIVFMEAMYLGLPILTTNVGGQNDFLTNGKNSILVDTSNPENITKAINFFQKNPGKLLEFGQKNAMLVEQYEQKNVIPNFEQLFLKV